MWLVNLPKKKGLWAAQGTPHVFVKKSPCSNYRPRHHSWEWLLFSCTPAEASIPADKISGYTHLLPHAVHPSFIFLTPGWECENGNQRLTIRTERTEKCGKIELCICTSMFVTILCTADSGLLPTEILIRQQLELPFTCLCFFQTIGDKVNAKPKWFC